MSTTTATTTNTTTGTTTSIMTTTNTETRGQQKLSCYVQYIDERDTMESTARKRCPRDQKSSQQ